MKLRLPVMIFFGLLLAVPLAAFVLGGGGTANTRLFGLGMIAALMGLAWMNNRFEVALKERPWRQLAEQTGLTCEVGGLLMGSSVHVVGFYRGRYLTLYTPRHGKGQVQSTRLELRLHDSTDSVLRLRGPFPRNVTEHDVVTSSLFATTAARQFGDDKRFYIRSQPLHLATALTSNTHIWSALLSLPRLTTIEVDNNTLVFEQLDVLTDVEHLHFLFDLLSDIADTLEQTEDTLGKQQHAEQVSDVAC